MPVRRHGFAPLPVGSTIGAVGGPSAGVDALCVCACACVHWVSGPPSSVVRALLRCVHATVHGACTVCEELAATADRVGAVVGCILPLSPHPLSVCAFTSPTSSSVEPRHACQCSMAGWTPARCTGILVAAARLRRWASVTTRVSGTARRIWCRRRVSAATPRWDPGACLRCCRTRSP